MSAPYTYSWLNSLGNPVANPTTLSTGSYLVEVTDNRSHVKSLPVIVGNPVNWTNLQNVSSSQGKLFTIGFASTYSNSGAISQSGMGAGANGGITYIYKSGVTNYVIGLSTQNTNPDWTTILYSTYIYNNSLFIYESGNVVKIVEGIEDQDRISIFRAGAQVVFYKNSEELHRMPCVTTNLYADATLESGQTPAVFASWCTTTATDLSMTYTQTSIDDCNTATAEGAITLQGNGGSAAYTYNWGGNTDNPRTELAKGLYNVTLTSGAATLASPVVVGGLANWGALTANTTQIAGTITTTTLQPWNNPNGALSTNRLAAGVDGGISFIVPDNANLSNYQIGLSSATTTTANWEAIEYGVWINSENSVRIYESGTDRGATQAVAAGDRISVIRRAGNVEYYINSKQIRITTTGTVTQELAADVSIIQGTSPAVYTSFCNPGARIANKTRATPTKKEITVVASLGANTLSIYPNPSTGTFNIRFATSLSENTEVTVFDGIGRTIKTQIFEKNNQKFSINLNNQPKGVYLIRFNQKGIIYSKSIIIE